MAIRSEWLTKECILLISSIGEALGIDLRVIIIASIYPPHIKGQRKTSSKLIVGFEGYVEFHIHHFR